MAKITLHTRVIARLHEIEDFYLSIDENLAERVLEVIFRWFEKISQNPRIGRPQLAFPELERAELREAIVPFGQTGFVVLYRYIRDQEEVIVLALRHQRERGFERSNVDAS